MMNQIIMYNIIRFVLLIFYVKANHYYFYNNHHKHVTSFAYLCPKLVY